jgi:hypothetical protein
MKENSILISCQPIEYLQKMKHLKKRLDAEILGETLNGAVNVNENASF